jgi:membrane-bound lytic murein transglycosylase B
MTRSPVAPLAAIGALIVSMLMACGAGGRDDPAQQGPPAPDAAVPRDPARLAESLDRTSAALRDSIDAWVRDGDTSRAGVPSDVTLHALYQQRIYRLLARRPRLAARTLSRLPAPLRPFARDVVTALRELGRLTPPTRRRRFRTGPSLPAGALLDHYARAERRFGVARHVLAAVNLVETAFNKLRSSSSAGAQGPMQFIPSTWKAYGMGGDVHDPRDAIHGAANYLRRSGAPGNYRRALYAYNPSTLYVNAVLRYARQIARSRRAYFNFYGWQVFVRTPAGERRLTGPGLRR